MKSLKVAVYFNLHTGLWSIKALSGEHKGLVIGHAKAVELNKVTFRVSEAGRQRVLRERRKNVHAYAIGSLYSVSGYQGRLVSPSDLPAVLKPEGATYCVKDMRRVSYNPYKWPLFYHQTDAGELYACRGAALVTMLGDRSVYVMGWKREPMEEALQMPLGLAAA